MAKGKSALTLAKEYNWNTEDSYFDYIAKSLINGQRQQVRSLFSAMNKDSKDEFLNTWCNSSDTNDYYGKHYIKTIRNICINELIYN